jgi:hypothetical protein
LCQPPVFSLERSHNYLNTTSLNRSMIADSTSVLRSDDIHFHIDGRITYALLCQPPILSVGNNLHIKSPSEASHCRVLIHDNAKEFQGVH